jgi:pimeloyl-ACP methyl ester carboxylesterase
LLQTLSGLNYVKDKNLFIFPYDWRLSNFDTANQLAKLIAETPDLKDQQYDILAHSMGGIVANVYLQQAHDKNAKRLINLGVPLRGSMNALAETSEGWGGIENYMAGGMTTIRRVMFSFPSLFELMPSYDKCCRIGTTASYHEFDPTETDLWKSHDWLPAEYQAGDGYAGLQARMDRARELRELVAKPLPPEIQQIFFAGDMIATKLYLYVDPSKQSWQNWNYSTSVGDGTVPIWSAAGQNGVGPSQPSFSDHAQSSTTITSSTL